MLIVVTKYPNKYSFTGNPVVFEVATDSDDSVNVEISIDEKTYSTTYYPFKLSENSYKIIMNLSDYLHFNNNADVPDDEIISVMNGFAKSYQVKIGTGYTFNGIALHGGISNHAFKELEEKGYNIFNYRLASAFNQFLFINRTNGKEIRIKESELYPFIFIHPGNPIVFKSESGNQVATQAQASGTVCAMNLRQVLLQMPAGTKRIDVFQNDQYVFHFTILPGKLSEEKYLIRFRNSLGAFEVLEVTGRALHNPEFSDENLWQTFTEFDFYEDRRSRVKSKAVIEVETGYKERGEFPFILDLIQSDEIFFIYPEGDSFRCHVKADSAQFRHLMTEPTSVKLKITPVLEEEFVTPEIEIPEGEDVIVYESEFIFKVNIKSTKIGQELKICNLGTSDGIGYAEVNWGDGAIEQKQVNQSSIQYIDDPANGGQMEVMYGDDFKHTYSQAGEYTVSIQSTKRVNGFRFAPLPIAANNEWYTLGQMNDYVTQIIKIKSNYIINGSRMFSGVRYGWFDSDFVLECPNITNPDYMFEFFGVDDYSYGNYPPVTWNLLFPENFWAAIADKTKITSMTRCFNGSGFLTIKRAMLKCSTALTSVLETWRGMQYVGSNWTERFPVNTFSIEVSEFVESDLFWDNHNIKDYKGCFWFINDFYGQYPDTGYSYQWLVKKDMFRYNQANNIDISFMFKQANRMNLEEYLFEETDNSGKSFAQRIIRMDGVFWGALNQCMSGRIGGSRWLIPPATDVFNGRRFMGSTDLNLLFPDNEYPNLISAVGAFGTGWRDPAHNQVGTLGGRQISGGFHGLSRDQYQDFNENYNFNYQGDWWLHTPQLNIMLFIGKFTKCTEISGYNPQSGNVDGKTDGLKGCFWDFAELSIVSGTPKAEDMDTAKILRPQVVEQVDLFNWGWGISS